MSRACPTQDRSCQEGRRIAAAVLRSAWERGGPSLIVGTIVLILVCCQAGRPCRAAGEAPEKPVAHIRLEPGHPWRPPFGLDRIGRPLAVVVEIVPDRKLSSEYVLVGYLGGKEIARSVVPLNGTPPCSSRVSLDSWPTELVLMAKPAQGPPIELVRQTVEPPPFEADAVACPDRILNPVDLGAILVPADWLLLAERQTGAVQMAALCRTGDVSDARAIAWFASAPTVQTSVNLTLSNRRRVQVSIPLPPASTTLKADVLHVSIARADGSQLWQKTIQTMLVHELPKWPEFGAVEAKLRYDAPISVRGVDGKFSSMSYAGAWDANLNDVVVAMPNGTRFVFWRGSSYIPFWAGRRNTGFCYEWAETTPPADGFADCVEPLMDKQLRYGRVEIIESTAARVHVRWRYQSCDFKYKVWGDSAVEDYYFYPDGFGTRVLTLQSKPKADYELSEFIVLTPQSTYPLSVLPPKLVDILFVDGQRRELTFPWTGQAEKLKSRDMPAIFRVRLHKDEPLAAVYFSPQDKNLPQGAYGPFFDKGQLVTPAYWGSHWPLARGNTTGGAINDRLGLTPCHNSILTWGFSHRPTPLGTAEFETIDTLGRSRTMSMRTWAWLIGMSDASDERLLQWAHSFSAPPSLELQGARLDARPYCPERRAVRLVLEEKTAVVTIKPATVWVNPVFETSNAKGLLLRVELADHALDAKHYAWDGKTLWIDATLAHDTQLRLRFGDAPPGEKLSRHGVPDGLSGNRVAAETSKRTCPTAHTDGGS